jgi:hypothetical protein
MTTKTETFDGEYANANDDELHQIEEQVNAAKDLPMPERGNNMVRILARFLHKRGKLPTDLKKHLDN